MKIYCFGDSYSCAYNHDSVRMFGVKYSEFKGYQPKIYAELLSEHYQCELINDSYGGIDNETIFYKFINRYCSINPDDIVIFGWTDIVRFPIAENGVWRYSTQYVNDNCVNWMYVMRNDNLFVGRFLNLIDFINKTLPNNKIIHWKWSLNQTNLIAHDTNNMLRDSHYSEHGHQVLFERILNKLASKKIVELDLPNNNLI